MTLDGKCDHTVSNADDELHRHFTELLRSSDTVLYGRITYQLMESFWPGVAASPTGNKTLDEFALAMEGITKVVFSRTLRAVTWKTARLAQRDPAAEVEDLRRQPGGDILVGSRSLIVSLMNLGLIDELQLCVHAIIAGKGLPLFENIAGRTDLKLIKTKTLSLGTMALYYEVGTLGA